MFEVTTLRLKRKGIPEALISFSSCWKGRVNLSNVAIVSAMPIFGMPANLPEREPDRNSASICSGRSAV
ncbi:hypothetical protein JJB99_11670 [Bradyrhizobium diazoefficiens]|uniref:hypothetical protein n=1 Tax=Bradyrhizobium diazoefficiens TaxID=1355477 RepID=UPI00190E4302|nr:hypothetical protein [Bradyrhizobium diazoefficiens]QQO16757.1 hypothetical protein JJB99_11670 [Bradyrhizobium diazoefficiens]